jgi:hypothetical protein
MSALVSASTKASSTSVRGASGGSGTRGVSTASRSAATGVRLFSFDTLTHELTHYLRDGAAPAISELTKMFVKIGGEGNRRRTLFGLGIFGRGHDALHRAGCCLSVERPWPR